MVISGLFARRRCPSPPGSSRPAPALIEALEPRLLLSGSIEGTVWHDLNADGLRDGGEAGLNGWTVELVDAATMTVVDTQTTAEIDLDGNGTIDPDTEVGVYQFTNVGVGNYTVRSLFGTGWAKSTIYTPGPGEGSGEFHVNTTVEGTQSKPGIASNSTGQYVVVWLSEDAQRVDHVVGQLYAADGTRTGGEFRVNTNPEGVDDQREPKVAMDESGAFVVAWAVETEQGVADYYLYARRYHHDGTPNGDEFRVTEELAYGRHALDVAMNGAGRMVFAWSNHPAPGPVHAIRARIYTAGGTPEGDSFEVAAETDDDVSSPEVAMGDSGQFVVVWTRTGPVAGEYHVAARRFHADGTPMGDEFQANTMDPSRYPFVDMNSSGAFVIGWASDYWPTNDTVFARRFSADGSPKDSERLLGGLPGENVWDGEISMDDSGRYVAVWRCYGDGDWSGVYGRMVHSDGTFSGDEFLASVYTAGDQYCPTVDLDASGRFRAIWTSAYQDPDGSTGLIGRQFPGFSDDNYEGVAVHGEGIVAGPAFGYYQVASISGQVFEDTDIDGLRDPGEAGLDGWTVQLVDPATGGVIGSKVTAGTDVNGNGTIDPVTESGLYSFEGLAPGQYVVREVVAGGWLQTYPTPAAYTTALVDNQDATGFDFGGAEYGSIGGQKFEDLDGDGGRGPGRARAQRCDRQPAGRRYGRASGHAHHRRRGPRRQRADRPGHGSRPLYVRGPPAGRLHGA